MPVVSPSPFRSKVLDSWLIKKTGVQHSYGCLMAMLPKDISDEIVRWSNDFIPDSHLGIGGREDEPHVTIKYGFRDNSAGMVRSLISMTQELRPIPIKLGVFSLFRGNKDGDVLKVGVSSPVLVDLNKRITESFDCEDKYPQYYPHATVAYINPNFASAYTYIPAAFLNREVLITELEWSPPEGARKRISLGEVVGQKSIDCCPSCGGFVITDKKSMWCGRPPCEWSESVEGKTLSWLDNSRGGALVPPPEQPKAKKRSRLGGFIPQAPRLGKSLSFEVKAAGQPCKQGESATRTGCIPKSKTPGKKPAAQAKPTPKKKPAPAQPKQPTPAQQAAAAKKQAAVQAKLAAQQAKQQAAQAKAAAKLAAQQAKQTAKAAAAAAKVQAKQAGIQAKKQAIADAKKFADDVIKKKQKGEALTPAELGSMGFHLDQLSVSELTKLKSALGVGTKDKTKNDRVNSLIIFASQIGVKPAAPTPSPKPAPVPTPAPAAAPIIPTSPTADNKLSGNDPNQRDEIDDIVEIALEEVFSQSGAKADYNDLRALLGLYSDDVWEKVKDAFEPGTDKDFVLGRAMRSLHSQRATKIVNPLYSNGEPRLANKAVPDELRPDLKLNEAAAIQSYTGTTYRLLNGKLRQEGRPSPKLKNVDRDIDAAFRKVKPLDKPISLSRAVTLDPASTTAFIGALQSAQASGSAWKDGGYMSTTTNPNPPGKGTNNIEMRIKATHGLDAKPYSHCPQANEVILHKDSGFKVSSVKQDSSGRWVVEMEQVVPSFITPAKPGTPGKPAVPPTPKPGLLGKLMGGTLPGTGSPAIPATPGTPAQISPAPKYLSAGPPKPAKDFTSIEDSQTVKDLLSGKNLHTLHKNTAGGGREDTALTDILNESGRANTPQIKSSADIDSLANQGWAVIYRSVADEWQTDQFRQGEAYNGAGIYGNGTYGAVVSDKIGGGKFHMQEGDAKNESRQYGKNTMRMALPPTAKIAKFSQIRQEVKQYHTELQNQYKSKQLSAIEYHRLRALTADPGRYAALKNYDAIDCEGDGYINILNRSILVVQDTNVA